MIIMNSAFVSPLTVVGERNVFKKGKGLKGIPCAKLELPSQPVNVVAKKALRELRLQHKRSRPNVKMQRKYGKGVLKKMIKDDITNPITGFKKSKRRMLRDGFPLNELAVGTKLSGVVQNMVKHGVYVDVGAVTDGLVHVRDMSSGFVHEPRDLVRSGDVVDVWVKYVNPEKKVLGLSMVERSMGFGGRIDIQQIGEGERYRGVVERVTNYGLYVDIGAERLAFLHVSGLWGNKPREVLDDIRLGQDIWVQVVEVDPVRSFIRLLARGIKGDKLDDKMLLGEALDFNVEKQAGRKVAMWKELTDDEKLGYVDTDSDDQNEHESEHEDDETQEDVRGILGIDDEEEEEIEDDDEDDDEDDEDIDAEFEAFFDEIDEDEERNFETEHGNVEGSSFSALSKKAVTDIEDFEEIEHMFDENTDFLDEYQQDPFAADVM